MIRFIPIMILALFLIGCIGGQTYKHALHNDEIIVVEDVGHSSMARNGAQMSIFYRCEGTKEDPVNCEEIGKPIQSVNAPMLPWILSGGATVGAAALIGDGLRDSGDNVEVGGSNINNSSSSVAGAKATASAKAKGGNVQGGHKSPYKNKCRTCHSQADTKRII